MDYEYARFGAGIVRREKDSAEPWEDVPPDDVQEAELEVRVAEELRKQNREHPRRVASRVIRSERNQTVAAEFGLNADELADRMARPDHNMGTRTRVSDPRFDMLVSDTEGPNLDPQEARDRLSGRFWKPPSIEDKSDHKAN